MKAARFEVPLHKNASFQTLDNEGLHWSAYFKFEEPGVSR
jgi:hypothetical protein